MADDNSKIEDERTLAKIIAQRGVLNVKDATAVILQLVKAVDQLHSLTITQGQLSAAR